MKTIVIIALIFVLTSISYSQNDCNCERALKQLIQKIETEYPGFNDKTKDKLLYNSFKENMIAKAGNITESNCIELLRSYKDFFRDGHISIYPSGQEQTVKQNKVAISLEEFQKHILNTTDPMEGVWRSGAYKVGIIRMNNV